VRYLDVVQGGPEWHAARAGIPTASNFDKLLTPAKLEPSKSAAPYRNHLIAEWLLGQAVLDDVKSGFMVRGHDLEQDARDWYEMARGVELTPGGFCLRDDGSAGCSPDNLVGDDGMAEFKTPSAANHVGYMLDGFGNDHRLQVQGGLWVTGRQWQDIVSYSPRLPKVLLRVVRDEKVIDAIANAVQAFTVHLTACKEELLSRGYKPLPPKPTIKQALAESGVFWNG
jgi:hypothetical protein